MVSHALEALAANERHWAKVVAPASAMVATAWRLDWQVLGAFRLVTDKGRLLELKLDPPKVTLKEVEAAVRR